MKFPGRMIGEVLRHVGKAPATVRYPLVQAELPEGFRGQIRFISANCNGCRLCEKDCPALAIEIREIAKKTFEALFHLDRCIYCSQCARSCLKGSLEVTPVFELAVLDRSRLKVVFHVDQAAAGDAVAPADDAAEPAPEQ